MNEEKTLYWEKEFEELFEYPLVKQFPDEGWGIADQRKVIKSFIRSELQKHDAMLIARIEKLPDYEIKSTMYETEILIHKDDVLKLIRGVQAT